MSVTMERVPETLYRKKSWVPAWLWNWLASPDLVTQVQSAMHRARETYIEKMKQTFEQEGRQR